jgi:hypothetical protein
MKAAQFASLLLAAAAEQLIRHSQSFQMTTHNVNT